MEFNMGINLRTNLGTKQDNEIELNIKQREIMINKFIEKFPKVKLHTVIGVNKYLNNNQMENSHKIKLQEYILN